MVNPTPSNYALDVRYAAVGSVANDACTATAPLLSPNATYSGTLLGATSQLSNPTCADATGQVGTGAEVFYRYTAPATPSQPGAPPSTTTAGTSPTVAPPTSPPPGQSDGATVQ